MPTFNGPVEAIGANTIPGDPGYLLFRHLRPRPVGLNVFLLRDGTATGTQPMDDSVVRVLRGGIAEEVSTSEAAALTAAGYGGYLE